MNERDWVEVMRERIERSCISHSSSLRVLIGLEIPYGYEITHYSHQPSNPVSEPQGREIKYETDLVITESEDETGWKPRVIMECKVGSINTHDSITYSQKASTHKAVHPYLRYGIILGNRGAYPLPGRLYRHGANFDFMMSFKDFAPTEDEMIKLTRLIHQEVDASRQLERIIYESRKKDRERFTLLHRKLVLE